MTFYERVAAKPGGERALAAARLRRSVLTLLHKAFAASEFDSQSTLAKRLRFRRSAVNQVFRGDGNLRINTLAEYLFEMGFEANISLVRAGELRAAILENRSPVPAIKSWSASSSLTYTATVLQELGAAWILDELPWRSQFALVEEAELPQASVGIAFPNPNLNISIDAVFGNLNSNLSRVRVGSTTFDMEISEPIVLSNISQNTGIEP